MGNDAKFQTVDQRPQQLLLNGIFARQSDPQAPFNFFLLKDDIITTISRFIYN